MANILIIEDEREMRDGLKLNLEYEGHRVAVEGDGDSGLATALEGGIDLIVLDVMMPGRSGIEVLKELREKGYTTPVVMLTARGLESDKVQGLKLGADDYVTKPFSLRELAARIEAVLRRAYAAEERNGAIAGNGEGAAALGTFEFADVVVDFAARTVVKANDPVTLSYKEFELLGLLIQHRGQTVSRAEVLDKVWGFERHAQPTTRTIDTHIANLRKKLEDSESRGRYIRTVHKIGYRFVPEGE